MQGSTLRFIQGALAVGIILGSAGCGSTGGALTGPTGSQRATATIQGNVNGHGAASSSAARAGAASGANIRVSVMGTALSAQTDGSGHFVLAGVPTGSVSLRFEGSGIDAVLTISGLTQGQVLTIDVQVAGSHASVTGSNSSDDPAPSSSPSPGPSPSTSPSHDDHPDDGQEVELKGTIEAVTPPSLRVAGQAVVTDSATVIVRGDKHVSLADLHVGDKVEVDGTRLADGSIRARKIKVEDADDDHGDDAEDDHGDDGDSH